MAAAMVLSGGCQAELESREGGAGGAPGERPDGLPVYGEDDCRPAPQKVWQLSAGQLAAVYGEILGVDPTPLKKSLQRYAIDTEPFSSDPAVLAASPQFVGQWFVALAALVDTAFESEEPFAACLAETVDDACGEQVIEDVAERAFRRPLLPEERSQLIDFYHAQSEQLDETQALKLALRRILGGPEVLFRRELGEIDEAEGLAELSAHELAELASFTIADRAPDEELRAAADDGSLLERAVLEEQIERLLQTYAKQEPTEAEETLGDTASGMLRFFREYFDIDQVRLQSRPELEGREERVLRWFDNESMAFLSHVMWEDTGKLRTLFEANYTFWSNTLADQYGLGFEPPQDGMTKLPAVDGRVGLLLHGSFLTAHPTTTTRGKFIRERLLCGEVPEPPTGVETNLTVLQDEAEEAVGKKLSPRQVRAQHMEDPGCAGCHELLDPLGFPFDAFDDVGTIRDSWPDGSPIDTQGGIARTKSSDQEVDDAAELALALAESADVHDCFVEQVYSFVHGRAVTEEDACYLEQHKKAFAESGGDIVSLMADILLAQEARQRIPLIQEQ